MWNWLPRFWREDLSSEEANEFGLEVRWKWRALMFGWPNHGIMINVRAIEPINGWTK